MKDYSIFFFFSLFSFSFFINILILHGKSASGLVPECNSNKLVKRKLNVNVHEMGNTKRGSDWRGVYLKYHTFEKQHFEVFSLNLSKG